VTNEKKWEGRGRIIMEERDVTNWRCKVGIIIIIIIGD
jgi:hypothetical protein